jgi:hypothetical protein
MPQEPVEPEGKPKMEGTPQVVSPETNGGFEAQSAPSVQIPDVEFQTPSKAAPQADYDVAFAGDVPTVSQEVAYQKPDAISEESYTQEEAPVQTDIITQIAPEIAPPTQDSLYSGPSTQTAEASGVSMTGEPFHVDPEDLLEQLQSQADQILPGKTEPSVIPSEIEFPNISQPDYEITPPVQPEAEVPMQQSDFQVKEPESAVGMVSPPPQVPDQGGPQAPILESNQIPEPEEVATQKMKKVSLTDLKPPSEDIVTENMVSDKSPESGMLPAQPSQTIEPHDIPVDNIAQSVDRTTSAPLLSNSQSTDNYNIELAEFYTKQGRLEKAIEIYRKLVQSNPSNHALAMKLQEAENLFNASGGSTQAPNDNL